MQIETTYNWRDINHKHDDDDDEGGDSDSDGDDNDSIIYQYLKEMIQIKHKMA